MLAAKVSGFVSRKHGQNQLIEQHYAEPVKHLAIPSQTDALQAEELAERGRVKQQSGFYSKAIIDFEAALQLDPKCSSALAGLGENMRLRGYHPKAITYFNHALKINPVNISALTGRAMANQQFGFYNAALTDFSSVLKIEPANVQALIGYAEIQLSKQVYDEALAYFAAALKIDAKNIKALKRFEYAKSMCGQSASVDSTTKQEVDPVASSSAVLPKQVATEQSATTPLDGEAFWLELKEMYSDVKPCDQPISLENPLKSSAASQAESKHMEPLQHPGIEQCFNPSPLPKKSKVAVSEDKEAKRSKLSVGFFKEKTAAVSSPSSSPETNKRFMYLSGRNG